MVTDWAPGDEVMTHPLPLRDQGTWAPTLIAPAALLAHKPTGVSWDVGAVFPVPALTAVQVLDEALEVNPGDRLLVNGAGGVTGRLLVALGSLRGAEVVATAGPRSHEAVTALGASNVIDYHDEDWPDQVLAITGGAGVSAAANAVTGGAKNAIRAVTNGGRLATITSDPPPQERAIKVSNYYVRPDGGQLRDLAKLLAVGQLPSRSRRPTGLSTPPMRSRVWSAGVPVGRSRSRCRPDRASRISTCPLCTTQTC